MKNSNTIKVAMLTSYTQGQGGSVNHIKKVIKYSSRRRDIELHVITLKNKKNDNIEGAAHYNIHEVQSNFYPFNMPFIIKSMMDETKRINPDIIHAIGTYPPYSTAAALLCVKYPTILTVMGLMKKDIEFMHGLKRYYSKWIKGTNEKFVISKIPNLILQTPYIKSVIQKMTRSRYFIVPEGIEYQEIQSIKPYPSDRPIDIFIAVRLWKLKGIDILIKAAKKIIPFIPDLCVYIAGSGEEEGNYRNLVKELNLENHIIFLGHLNDERLVNSFYHSCRIVVVPSRWDMDPFAPLNAAAAGKPSIVSDRCHSVLVEDGKNGFIFPSEDVEILAEKIRQLLLDEALRTELGAAAKKKSEKFDWVHTINQNIEAYHTVIKDFRFKNDLY